MSLIIKNNKEFSVIKVEPYNQQIINIIKEFKDRKFNNESKEFSLPNAEMDLLKSKLENGALLKHCVGSDTFLALFSTLN